MNNAGKLSGKIAIVTGSGRGIGRAIAMKLAEEGAAVVINDLDEGPVQETIAALEARGRTAYAFPGDVTAADFGERMLSETLARFGGVDIIVNNAGYIWNTAIQNHTDEQWYAMLDVHATAPFRLLRAAAEYFRDVSRREATQGSIACRKVVNISSLSGVYGAATQLAYSAGKAAVIGMTRTLAKELGRYNVTVNCVAYGHIATRLTQPIGDAPRTIEVNGRELKVGLSQNAIEMGKALTPLGRPGTLDEAAGAVYLLCIPESDFISGQVLHCSGGLIL
ncbi:MAG: SDR family oxidoreductase [Blastocatellia bacterium]|nr:SDR family oxidoreductase [Blastocatellia bacterium]